MVDLNSNRDDVLALVAKFKDEALVPMKEDIAEWLEALLDPAKFDPVELLTTLQTGIVACQAAQKLCQLVQQQLASPKCNTRAKVGTFFARDNAANFLTWCREIGVDNSVLFESDGMCSSQKTQTTPRQVLLCFLDVARIFGKKKDFTGPLPDLVRFEHEIDACSSDGSISQSTPSGRASAPPSIDRDPLSPRSGVTPRTRHSVRVEQTTTPTRPVSAMHSRLPTSRRMTPSAKKDSPRKTPSKQQKPTLLEKSIQEVKESTPYSNNTVIERVSEGKYKIDGKLVFIRMLKNKHVMVRVGGGWDTLANYLVKHDCQKMVKMPTPSSPMERFERKRKFTSPLSPLYQRKKGATSSPSRPGTSRQLLRLAKNDD